MSTPLSPKELKAQLAARGWSGECSPGAWVENVGLLSWTLRHDPDLWGSALGCWQAHHPETLAAAVKSELLGACQRMSGLVPTLEEVGRLLDAHRALGLDLNEGVQEPSDPALSQAGMVPSVEKDAETCLTMACRRRPDLVAMLLARGADPCHRGGRCSPLASAMAWHLPAEASQATVALLLAHGADPNELHDGDGTILSFAVYHRQLGCVPLLLAAGADPNGPARNGDTSILTLAAFVAPEVLENLLAAHADEAPLAQKMADPHSGVHEEARAFWAERMLRAHLPAPIGTHPSPRNRV